MSSEAGSSYLPKFVHNYLDLEIVQQNVLQNYLWPERTWVNNLKANLYLIIVWLVFILRLKKGAMPVRSPTLRSQPKIALRSQHMLDARIKIMWEEKLIDPPID